MYLLADIGGTHARFALGDDNEIGEPQKYSTEDFKSVEEALSHFCAERNQTKKPTLLIATAARQEQDGTFRFTNGTSWSISASELENKGWETPLVVNDFVASARGALVLPDHLRQVIKEGRSQEETPCCILGPGTGLGYAYMHEMSNGKWHVQETAGARMQATAVTDEQRTIVNLVERLKGTGTIVSYENLASGRALPIMHKAVCLYNGQDTDIDLASDLFEQAEDSCAAQTLRLFHEFLGLFAHNAIVTAHAYRGLYLDGGVLHRLRDKMLFDFKTFEKFMTLEPIPYVKDLIENMPVTVVKDPFVALRGVLELYKDAT